MRPRLALGAFLESWMPIFIAVLSVGRVANATNQQFKTFFMDQQGCSGEREAQQSTVVDTFAVIFSHYSAASAASLQKEASSGPGPGPGLGHGLARRLPGLIPAGTPEYPANIDCQLLLLVPVHWRILFRFEYIDIPCVPGNDDAVYAFDGGSAFTKTWPELGGPKGLCAGPRSSPLGTLPLVTKRFNTSGIYLTVVFKTGSTGSKATTRRGGKGFKMIATAVTDCPSGGSSPLVPAVAVAQSFTIYKDVGLFRCSNGLCLRLSLRCDGIDHCGDHSDELDCEISTGDIFHGPSQQPPRQLHLASQCPSLEPRLHEVGEARRVVEEYPNGVFLFRCNNGLCMNATHLCNGEDNCADGSDEILCPSRTADYEASTESTSTQADIDDANLIAKFLKLGVAATLAIACGTIVVLGAVIGTTICLCMKRLKSSSSDNSSDSNAPTHSLSAPPGYQQVAMQPGSKCPSSFTPTHQRRLLTVYPSGASLSGTDVTQHTGSSTQHTVANSAVTGTGAVSHSPYHVMYPQARSTMSKMHNWNSYTTNETGIGTGITRSSPSPSSSYVIAPGLIYQPANAGSSTSSSVTATNASAPSGLMPLLSKRRNRHGTSKQFKLCHLDLPVPHRSTASLRSKTSSSSNERTLVGPNANTNLNMMLSVGHAPEMSAYPTVHSTHQSIAKCVRINDSAPAPLPEATTCTNSSDSPEDVIDETEEDKSSGVSLAMSETTKTTVIHQGVRQHPDCMLSSARLVNDFVTDDRRLSGVMDLENEVSYALGVGVPLPPAPMPAELLITSSTNENLSLTMRLARNLNLQNAANGL